MRSPTWEALAKRYSEFAAMPAWWAAGHVRASTDDPARLQAALLVAIGKLRSRYRTQWPSSPVQFEQQHVRFLFPNADIKAELRNPRRRTVAGQLWTAVILDRCDFSCCWCGRSALETFELERRTLRLELDHQTPRARGGTALSLENIRAACRSCNTLRGQLQPEQMLAELLSMARAILKTAGTSIT